jgi:hypothetical protein
MMKKLTTEYTEFHRGGIVVTEPFDKLRDHLSK